MRLYRLDLFRYWEPAQVLSRRIFLRNKKAQCLAKRIRNDYIVLFRELAETLKSDFGPDEL